MPDSEWGEKMHQKFSVNEGMQKNEEIVLRLDNESWLTSSPLCQQQVTLTNIMSAWPVVLCTNKVNFDFEWQCNDITLHYLQQTDSLVMDLINLLINHSDSVPEFDRDRFYIR